MFEWDRGNLRKIRAHRVKREEAEQALLPVPIYEQSVEGELSAGRLLAVIVTDRRDTLRVVTAYPLDASQKRDYLRKRVQGE